MFERFFQRRREKLAQARRELAEATDAANAALARLADLPRKLEEEKLLGQREYEQRMATIQARNEELLASIRKLEAERTSIQVRHQN